MSVLDVKYNQEMSNFVLSVIMEQKHYDYEKDDYVDIGISTFKDWLKDTKNLIGKFPFGYLVSPIPCSTARKIIINFPF